MNKYKKRRKKIFFAIVLITVFIIYGFVFVEKNIKPTVLAISEVKGRMIATQAINDAVKVKIKNDIKYKDLIYISYDKDGRVTTMQANTALMNSIASDVALEVQRKMGEISAKSIRIPLGNALNSQILSQVGPKFNINIVPKGTVSVDFETEFEESGINQTIHRVFLTIRADVKIIVPLGADTAQVSTRVPIAETIIVGDVPNNYIRVPKDEYMNVIPSEQ